MKLKITVLERMSMNIFFPKDSDMITLRLARDIKNKLELTEEEIETIEFRIDGSDQSRSYKWNAALTDIVDDKFDGKFSETEIRFLKGKVKEFDETKKIPDSLLELCERISDYSIAVKNQSENNIDKKVSEKVQ